MQRARKNTCLDQLTGKQMTFLEIFPEDLLCHASALSSSAIDKRHFTNRKSILLNEFVYFVSISIIAFYIVY